MQLISNCTLPSSSTDATQISTYIANLAAALTTQAQVLGITSLADLKGKNVFAHGAYVTRIQSTTYITTQTMNWNGSQVQIAREHDFRG